MASGVLIVELRRVVGGQATTLLASAHPDLVRAVQEAWARLVYGEAIKEEAADGEGVQDAQA